MLTNAGPSRTAPNPHGRGNPFRLTLLVAIGALLLLTLAVSACSSKKDPTATAVPPAPTDVPPAPTAVPDQSEIIAAWESGLHGNTYDLGKGPNTYCSRCHSPQNWDVNATTDRPPNCVTCKFPDDEEVRMATTMDFVEEEDWVGIGCDTCHEVDENGIASAEIAWLNVVTGEYEKAHTSTELCEKCHLTTAGIAVTGGSGVTHQRTLGGSAHRKWAGEWPQAERPQYCADCHDPHSGVPKQCVDCHTDVTTLETHIMGNNDAMLTKVTCMACHDADEMEVGPHPDEAEGGVFVTLVSSVGRTGDMTVEYVKSHSVQWQVACDRCHFADNPWDLDELTEDGEIPESEG